MPDLAFAEIVRVCGGGAGRRRYTRINTEDPSGGLEGGCGWVSEAETDGG